MKYKILPRTEQRASEIGALIQPSKNPKKKLDVLYEDRVYSIGDNGAMDYPYWLEVNPNIAEARRKSYLARHSKEKSIKSWLSKILLWS